MNFKNILLAIPTSLLISCYITACNNAGGASTSHSTAIVVTPQADSYNTNQIQALADSFVAKYKSDDGLSAVTITAQCNKMNNNQPITVFSGEFGHEPQYQRSIKNNDVWSIGSNSKAFTAIVLIKLASNPYYKFSLDDHVQKWLTKDKYPELQDLLRYNPTVRQLLNMTSGIANGNNPNAISYWIDHPYQYKSPVFWLGFANPSSDSIPGAKWSYTDTNYQILDLLVQQIANDTLGNKIKQYILVPLNLKNTYYIFDKPTDLVNVNRLVHTYYPDKGNILDLYDWSLSNNAGAGSILANSEDMNTFYRTLFTTNKILNQQEFQQMNTLVDTSSGQPINISSEAKNGEAFGLGIFEDDLEHLFNYHKVPLTQYPNLARDIKNYNNIYLYPGASTMAFMQIYNVKNGISLIAAYNSPNPNGPGLSDLALPVLNYLDGVCQ